MKLFCLNKLITLKSESESRSVMSGSLRPHGLYMGWHSLLQGIFPTQGSNPGLPHCGQILYQLSHKGSPRILEWVAFPFSRGSSWSRNPTRVSCVADSLPTELSRKPNNSEMTHKKMIVPLNSATSIQIIFFLSLLIYRGKWHSFWISLQYVQSNRAKHENLAHSTGKTSSCQSK